MNNRKSSRIELNHLFSTDSIYCGFELTMRTNAGAEAGTVGLAAHANNGVWDCRNRLTKDIIGERQLERGLLPVLSLRYVKSISYRV